MCVRIYMFLNMYNMIFMNYPYNSYGKLRGHEVSPCKFQAGAKACSNDQVGWGCLGHVEHRSATPSIPVQRSPTVQPC